jgi:hypothetical protein
VVDDHAHHSAGGQRATAAAPALSTICTQLQKETEPDRVRERAPTLRCCFTSSSCQPRSAAADDFEREVVEPERSRERRAIVDHRGCGAVGEQARAARRKRRELVEIDGAEPGDPSGHVLGAVGGHLDVDIEEAEAEESAEEDEAGRSWAVMQVWDRPPIF